MQLFAWHTTAIQGYRSGSVAVIAEDVITARWKIIADFQRWVRTTHYSEHSPLIVYYGDGVVGADGYPEHAEEWDREEIDIAIAQALEDLTVDITGEPIKIGEGGVLYQWGGD